MSPEDLSGWQSENFQAQAASCETGKAQSKKKRITILELLGLAVGRIGMSRTDFLQLTPEEFSEIAGQWNQNETVFFRSSWEQTRFMAHCILTPFSKKKLNPTDIVRFDWEKEKQENKQVKIATREDFERVKKEYGG